MSTRKSGAGYTSIANEILESLCKTNIVISHYEWQCLIFIFRKTFGWHKNEDRISLSQFVLGTNIKRPHVCRALKKLLNKRIITQTGNGYHVTYSFQKNNELWKSLPKRVIVTQLGNRVVPNQVMQVVPNWGHTKETTTKETLQKKGVVILDNRKPNPNCEGCNGSGSLPDGVKCWCWK